MRVVHMFGIDHSDYFSSQGIRGGPDSEFVFLINCEQILLLEVSSTYRKYATASMTLCTLVANFQARYVYVKCVCGSGTVVLFVNFVVLYVYLEFNFQIAAMCYFYTYIHIYCIDCVDIHTLYTLFILFCSVYFVTNRIYVEIKYFDIVLLWMKIACNSYTGKTYTRHCVFIKNCRADSRNCICFSPFL